MQQVLARINRIAGVRGSLVVDREGFVVAASMSDGYSPATLAALGSNVASSLGSALSRLHRGSFERLSILGTGGSVVLLAVGHGSFLVTLLGTEAMMGMVQVELKDAAGVLRELMHL